MGDSISSSLPLTHCPFCDYELTGLPSAGICPECGKAYDDRFVVLFGFATGKTATIRNGSPKLVGRRVFGKLLPMIIVIWALARGPGFRTDPWLMYLIGNSLISLAITIAMRFASLRQAPSMVILCQYGVEQRDTVDTKGVLGFLTKFWTAASFVLIGCYIVNQSLWHGADYLMIAFVALAIAFGFQYGVRRKKDNEKREITGPGSEPISITPWQHIQRAELEPALAGRFHLKFYRPGVRQVADTVYVDADVALDPEKADPLRELTRQWILNPQPIANPV